jgi:hypothetical protein
MLHLKQKQLLVDHLNSGLLLNCMLSKFVVVNSRESGLVLTLSLALHEQVSCCYHYPDTHCDIDPITSTPLKKCTSALLPTITTIINLSLDSGVFPDQFKSSSVHPPLKKYNSDKNELSHYRLSSIFPV